MNNINIKLFNVSNIFIRELKMANLTDKVSFIVTSEQMQRVNALDKKFNLSQLLREALDGILTKLEEVNI